MGLSAVEHTLIASKLGILFTLKTHAYVNFKSEYVGLNEIQLRALQEIFVQHFNVEMEQEIQTLVSPQETEIVKEVSAPDSHTHETGFFQTIKSFFKPKSKLQEEMA